MEDILILQFLKKKGVISDRDIHEFHELVSSTSSGAYNSEPLETINLSSQHIDKERAFDLVSKMYHTDGGKKYTGEKFDIYKAREVCDKYKGSVLTSINMYDVYVAINSHYHNYCKLFKRWFMSDAEYKIIEAAMVYWFADEDCMAENKIVEYFK